MQYDLCGYVATLGPVLTIRTQQNTQHLVAYAGKLPLALTDTIYATVVVINNVPTIVGEPFAQISYTREAIINVLSWVLGNRAERTYISLLSEHNTIREVAAYLDRNALHWSGVMLPGTGYKITVKILNKWREQRLVRALQLLGLLDTEIFEFVHDAHRNLVEMHSLCLTRPSAIFTLDADRMRALAQLVGVTVDELNEQCYFAVRQLYLNLHHEPCTMSQVLDELSTTAQFALEKEYPVLPLTEQYEAGPVTRWYLAYPGLVLQHLRQTFAKLRALPPTHVRPIMRVEIGDGKLLDGSQLAALRMALTLHFLLITGAAGTGKTSLIKAIVQCLREAGTECIIGSFTGKAVARLREVLGDRNATTLDYLVTVSKEGSLTTPYLIIDEVSMVSAELLYRVLKVFAKVPRLIFVGDPNQLPPIGWGGLLGSLLNSADCPHFALEVVHRCHNDLLINPHRIIRGEPLVNTQDFLLMPDVSPLSLFYDVLQRGWSLRDVTILSPYKEDVEALNYEIAIHCFGRDAAYSLQIGERVMFRQNLNTLSVFNGEDGEVTKADATTITVTVNNVDLMLERTQKKWVEKRFGNRFGEPNLTTALVTRSYALTIDKAQGSEWPIIIMSVPSRAANFRHLHRGRIYTAATRAKHLVFVTGRIDDVNAGIQRPFQLSGEHLF